jgi:hypothetical protein
MIVAWQFIAWNDPLRRPARGEQCEWLPWQYHTQIFSEPLKPIGQNVNGAVLIHHTVPYGTGPLSHRILAVNCQATMI